MARSPQATILLATVFCFLSLLGAAHCAQLQVVGEVYCDTCRIRFMTKVSQYMEGARVKLECRDREGGHLTYSHEGVTDASGKYSIPVDGDHDEEICEVVLVKSSRDDCNQFADVGYGKHSARVGLTSNNGMATTERFANPLGFFKNEALPDCAKVLNELGILPGFPYGP